MRVCVCVCVCILADHRKEDPSNAQVVCVRIRQHAILGATMARIRYLEILVEILFATTCCPQPPQKTLSLVKDEQVVKPKFKAFGGGGNVLGKDWTAEAYSKVSAAADASPASGGRGPPAPVVQSKEELASQLKEYAADASAPDVTSIQVRLPSGQRAQARLSAGRTVGDLRQWVVASGNVPSGQGFVLTAGFPPQPLSDENASLKDAALLNAAVIVRLL